MRKQLGFVGLSCLAAVVAAGSVGCGGGGSKDAGCDGRICIGDGDTDGDTGDTGTPDSGPIGCLTGRSCDPARGCNVVFDGSVRSGDCFAAAATGSIDFPVRGSGPSCIGSCTFCNRAEELCGGDGGITVEANCGALPSGANDCAAMATTCEELTACSIPSDGGMGDGGVDAGPPPADGGMDAGPPPADGGMDAGVMDAGEMDAGDTDTDAGETDAGGTDAGETDAGLPDGAADGSTPFDTQAVDVTLLPGAYCTAVAPSSMNDFQACSRGSCPDCASCSFHSFLGSMCMRNCEPSNDDNSSCRDGYACNPYDPSIRGGSNVCSPGCMSDEECKLVRSDENHDGFPEIVYDPTSPKTCNTDTYRCEHPGNDGVEAGDTCEFDRECEADGFCYSEAAFGFPDGYCAKIGCDVSGRECAGGGECQARGFGVPTCAQGCTVGAEPMDARLGTDGHGQGCREGYRCLWDGQSGDGVENSGACIPGNYNDVTEPNVGDGCEDPDGDGDLTAADTCYSPFGQGRCFGEDDFVGITFQDGYCSITDCGVPGIPGDICGPNASCVDLSGDGTFTACFTTCNSGDDCRPGYGCVSSGAGMSGFCFPQCSSDEDCRSDEVCDIGAGEDFGDCVPAE